ncbi:MAG: M14 family zinc carboxypeptidase [Blautia sp.]
MYKVSPGRFLGYTYENMQNDLGILARIFPEIIQIDSLGKTEDQRELYHFYIGSANAPKKILIFGGIHGREYMTSQLIMEQTTEFLMKLCRTQDKEYAKILEGKAIHVVPMVNPDGVTISQRGAMGIKNPDLKNLVEEIALREGGRHPQGSYFHRWKANAKGVDLNRNFDALWETCEDAVQEPSRENYKGPKPESEIESRALAELTRREEFQRTISYHSSGAVIYWDFYQQGQLRVQTWEFAKRIGEITGYVPQENTREQSSGGYKDWALLKMEIPSLTIEIGRQESPLPASCFEEIFIENRGVWEGTLMSF